MADRISIELRLEPVVKLYCFASKCKHNLLPTCACCNLKTLNVGPDGKCESFEERTGEEKDFHEPR